MGAALIEENAQGLARVFDELAAASEEVSASAEELASMTSVLQKRVASFKL